MDEKADPAALAASTAQGWTRALNATARPAPEHLEAAREALRALVFVDQNGSWVLDRLDLDRACAAARMRVAARMDDGLLEVTNPEVTVAQLLEAIGQLRAAGLVPELVPSVPTFVADGAITRSDHRIAELEQALEAAQEERDEERERVKEADAIARRQTELRDRFEREAREERDRAKGAHQGHSAAVAAARVAAERNIWLAVLARFGMNAPGFAEMETSELEVKARAQLGLAAQHGAQLQVVVKELLRAGQRLIQSGLDEQIKLPDGASPPALAGAVASLADSCVRSRSAAFARQRELEDRILAMRDGPDMTENERDEAAARDVIQRRRIAELEAIVQLRLSDSDEALGRQLERIRAERDSVMRSRDAQAEELRTLRSERNRAEVDLAKLEANLVAANRETARVRAQLAEYREADQR